MIPHGMTFRDALIRGYASVKASRYLELVKTLPCCVCSAPADDPHHILVAGYKGMNSKTPDVWAIPVCRFHHDELHHDRQQWEERHGTQMEHALLTFAHLFYEGDLVLRKV